MRLSVRLYAVLTSYLRGSALQLSRSMSSSKNGLQLWKVLVNQYAPATKQRSLAISQAIATYPGFTRDKTFAESIAGLEQLVNEYFVVTNKKFDEDVLLGVLLRCSPQSLRQHLTLTMTRETTYRQARELILGYERSAKTWDVQSVLKQFQASSSHDAQGPTPMEVDRVEKGLRALPFEQSWNALEATPVSFSSSVFGRAPSRLSFLCRPCGNVFESGRLFVWRLRPSCNNAKLVELPQGSLAAWLHDLLVRTFVS